MTFGVINVVFFVSVLAGICYANPCTDNVDLGNYKRSVNYELQPTDQSICDTYTIITGKWYTFHPYAGEDIPQRPIGENIAVNHCGTAAPIWIQGTGFNPQENQTLTAPVCANYGGGCDWSVNISLTTCTYPNGSHYRAYQLVTPQGCPGAYCAGQAHCPNGQTWDETATKCRTGTPYLNELPYIEGPFIDDSTYSNYNTFYFTCNVLNDTKPAGAILRVTFLFNGEESVYGGAGSYHLSPSNLTWSQLPAKLPGKYLRGRMGKWISCQVETYWHGSEEISSPYRSTVNNAYWAGIKYTGSTIDPVMLSNTVPTASVYYVPTVPVFCPTGDSVCPSAMVLAVASGSGNDQCQYQLTNEQWIGYTGPKTGPSNLIRISVDRHYAQNVHYELNFRAITLNEYAAKNFPPDDGPVWDGYVPPSLPVESVTTSTKACTATTDPHVSGFDNSGMSCGYFAIGTFVLMRSTRPRIFEVQIQTWQWKNDAGKGCICGVAVREGNQIIGISMCQTVQELETSDGSYYPLQTIKYLGEQGSGVPQAKLSLISSSSSNAKYQFTMPSGASVVADVHSGQSQTSHYMDLTVKPIAEDYQHAEGLCGQWNGVKSRHCETQGKWSVNAEASFFANYQHCADYQYPATPACGCDENEDVSCEDEHPTIVPAQNLGVTCHNKRRSTQTYDDNAVNASSVLLYTPYSPVPTPDPLWPTSTGIYELQAEAICNEAIRNSNVYNTCISNYNLTDVIESCKMDIAVSGDYRFLSGVVDAFQTSCLAAAQAGVVLTSTNQTEEQQQLMTVTNISSQVCPNQCSANGACVNSVCSCKTGFTGTDCSLIVGQPPTLLAFENGDLCDRRQKPCQLIRVYATNIDASASATLLCKIVFIGTGSVTYEAAQVTSSMELSCTLPPSPVWPSTPTSTPYTNVSYRVSLSNDGVHYSDGLTLTVYDSECVTCSNATTCVPKPSTCAIKGICYLPSDFEEDYCLTCQPDIKINVFTPSSADSCNPQSDDSGPSGVSSVVIISIAAVSIGVLIAVVVVAVVLYLNMTKAQMKIAVYWCTKDDTPDLKIPKEPTPPAYEEINSISQSR